MAFSVEDLDKMVLKHIRGGNRSALNSLLSAAKEKENGAGTPAVGLPDANPVRGGRGPGDVNVPVPPAA